MQRGHRAVRETLEQREMNEIDVEVEDVEFVGALAHLMQHREMRGDVGLERAGIEPDGLLAHGNESRRRAGVSAGEQGDVVPQFHQRVCQVGDDTLGAAV